MSCHHLTQIFTDRRKSRFRSNQCYVRSGISDGPTQLDYRTASINRSLKGNQRRCLNCFNHTMERNWHRLRPSSRVSQNDWRDASKKYLGDNWAVSWRDSLELSQICYGKADTMLGKAGEMLEWESKFCFDFCVPTMKLMFSLTVDVRLIPTKFVRSALLSDVSFTSSMVSNSVQSFWLRYSMWSDRIANRIVPLSQSTRASYAYEGSLAKTEERLCHPDCHLNSKNKKVRLHHSWVQCSCFSLSSRKSWHSNHWTGDLIIQLPPRSWDAVEQEDLLRCLRSRSSADSCSISAIIDIPCYSVGTSLISSYSNLRDRRLILFHPHTLVFNRYTLGWKIIMEVLLERHSRILQGDHSQILNFLEVFIHIDLVLILEWNAKSASPPASSNR